MIDISVVTPVGPYEYNKRWLGECMQSVRNQTKPPLQHIMAGDLAEFMKSNPRSQHPMIDSSPPTIAGNTNLAISKALSNWVVVLNSDDLLGTHCIEWLQEKIKCLLPINEHKPFFLRHPITRSESKEILRNGNCLHKEVWKEVGGYRDVIRHDVDFISRVLNSEYKVYDTDWGGEIGNPEEYYVIREHPDQEEKKWKAMKGKEKNDD